MPSSQQVTDKFDDELFDDELFDDDIGSPLDMRLDGRDKTQFTSDVRSGNTREDEIVEQIAKTHNAANLGSTIEIIPVGNRHDYFDNARDIPNNGDHKWVFSGKNPFSLHVESKSRSGPGNKFRPKKYDVRVCLTKNMPYLLAQNDKTDNCSLILLRMGDLEYIRDNYTSVKYEMRYGERWSPYQDDKSQPLYKWKGYYICKTTDDSDRFEHKKINFMTLKDQNQSYEVWLSVVNYFREISKMQNFS